MIPTIYVYNKSGLVLNAEAQAACAAIQRQVTEHFEPHWKQSAVIHFAQRDEPAPSDAWVFSLVDEMPGADSSTLGYHTDDGMPSALVDVKLCQQDGIAWSSCLSHEVLEAIADPECVRCFDTGGKVYALEVCDATEQSRKLDGTEYEIDGVVVENFVLPDWFIVGSPGPWDYLGVLPAPLTRTDGGYDETATIGPWSQTSGMKTRSAKLCARPGSRREARGL